MLLNLVTVIITTAFIYGFLVDDSLHILTCLRLLCVIAPDLLSMFCSRDDEFGL